MRTVKKIQFIAVALLTCAATAYGAAPKRGWVKLELSPDSKSVSRLPKGLLTAFGAELVSDYGSFAIIEVPEPLVHAIEKKATDERVAVRRRDDLDLVRLPSAVVDTRKGIENAPIDGLRGDYPSGTKGLFVIQFSGPPRPEWVAKIQEFGWQLERYAPANAYIAVGTTAMVSATRTLSFVQWVDIFQPYQKAFIVSEDDGDVTVAVPSGVPVDDTLARVRGASQYGRVDVQRPAGDVRLHARVTRSAAVHLLKEPLVIGIWSRPYGTISDERQAISATSQVSSNGSTPTATGYWDWITAASRCGTACTNMSSTNWRVGVADTGVDNGATSGGHVDLAGRKYPGQSFVTDTSCQSAGYGATCDNLGGHGTMVAGVIAGNAATTDTDGGGYKLGIGFAPTAGIVATKVSTDGISGLDFSQLSAFTADAISNGAYVQNHSINEASSSSWGKYSVVSRDYDKAVRDANGSTAGRPEILLTVSAGNVNSDIDAIKKLKPGATAKNVIAVGGTENYRTQPCGGCESDSYLNLMKRTRTGTDIAGYIKPDLVAPGSAIVSTASALFTTPNYCPSGGAIPTGAPYGMASGTSFAAPAVAGAALVVKRYLGSTADGTSPALTKAVLIAGARTIRSGEDRTQPAPAPPQTYPLIGNAPNAKQGFGRLSLVDILTGSTPPVYFDQSSTRQFTQAGQALVGRMRVRDASKPVKVVLVWSDAAAAEWSTSPLVNDLDLKVFPSTSGTSFYRGNNLQVATESQDETSTLYTTGTPGTPDSVNNVEYVRFFGSANQEFDVRVDAATIAGDISGDSTNEQDFALVIVNADKINDLAAPTVNLPAPQNFTAISGSATVALSWNAVSGADGYVVEKKIDAQPWFDGPTTTGSSSTTTSDTPAASGKVVLYRVRAVHTGTRFDPSSVEVAYASTFVDDTLTTTTIIRAAHITELRSAVNAFRRISGASDLYSSTEVDPNSLLQTPTKIDDTHVTTLLDQVNTLRAIYDLAPAGFPAPAPAGGVKIRKDQVRAVRCAFMRCPN